MALAGVVMLGPRLGKYGPKSVPMPGHSMALATLGVFILWMGWFGFNPGSTTGLTGGASSFSGSGKAAGAIAVTTNLAAAAGAFGALFGMLFLNRLPRLHHPLLKNRRFALATHDRFFVVIETADPKYSENDTRRLLEGLGSKHIEVVEE